MILDQFVYAGLTLSSGRRPVTIAMLDEDLNLLSINKWTLKDTFLRLKEYTSVYLGIHSDSTSADFKKQLSQTGFRPASQNHQQTWLELDSQRCYQVLCEHKLLSRRSVEGRLQRALLLFDQRLQIPDPMDFFEEITRHKLIQGILPYENLYSAHELDALMAAYVAWVFGNEPRRVQLVRNCALLVHPSDE